MKKKEKDSLETYAAGLASMNIGTAGADILNEPTGAAWIALDKERREAAEGGEVPEKEDPRKR